MKITIKSPWFITGIVDAEGTFSVPIDRNVKYNLGWRVQAKFQIGLHISDLDLLLKIQHFFGGIGSTGKFKNMVYYSISSIQDLRDIIIPHFCNYPLLTQKAADFLLLKSIVGLMSSNEHLTLKGLKQIIEMKAIMNRGLSNIQKTAFPECIPFKRPIIVTNNVTINPYWITGFVNGESSFDVKIYKSSTSVLGYAVQLRFRTPQHKRDSELINLIRKYFNAGILEKHIKFPLLTLVIVKFSDITEKIIPFFDSYLLVGTKREDYSDWCKIARLMSGNLHLTKDGFDLIQKLRSGMNKRRK
jgi:hypothetical protein